MADPLHTLKAKWLDSNRYANFGAVIRSIRIDGFRGIQSFSLDCEFPITAFSGLNGSGKSTIGQLAACAFRKPTEAIGYRRHYVKDFFPVSVADPTPFQANASVEFSYQSNLPASPQTVTVSRKAKEWSGYKRQPERFVFYVGFTLYLPKVERKDLSIYRGAAIELGDERELSAEAKVKVSRILNQPYDGIHFQGYSHKQRQAELGMASRWGSQYSENNMGFGEGRALYMVDLFETAPEQSLFVLEEPETSLHEDAQRRLGKYFLDVVSRRHHQIILTTHSSAILDALPPEARKLLYRDGTGLECYSGLSSTRARSILSGGAVPSLTICVEDEFAKLLLTEIVRKFVPAVLQSLEIVPIGDKTAVLNAVRLLRKIGRSAIGARDGDIGESPNDYMWSLPGENEPPEEFVFGHAEVISNLDQSFGVDIQGFRQLNPDLDIHQLPNELAKNAKIPVEALNHKAVTLRCEEITTGHCSNLIEAIESNA